MRTCPALAVLSVLAAGAASAHDADIIYAQIARGEDGLVTERLTLTPNTLLALAPLDLDGDQEVTALELARGEAAISAGIWEQLPLRAAAGPCTRKSASVRQKDNYFELTAAFACGRGELTQTFRILSVLPAPYRVVLGSYGEGALQTQAFAQGFDQTLSLLGEKTEATSPEVLRLGGWISIGITHILLGFDHIAFLLAILLVGGSWRRIFALVTSFTVAHSITLGATALGLIRLAPALSRWVEVAIAASIVWVALENLVFRQHRHRVLLTFGFGLVHGFGFASVLMEMGLGQSAALGLFGFNSGVEIGQACVVLVAYPLIRFCSRREEVSHWMVRLGSGAIFMAGAVWMVVRLRG